MFRIHTLQAYTITSLSNIYANSDKRLKENFETPKVNYLSLLNSLVLYEYNFISDPNKKKIIGLVAQDLEAALPEQYRDTLISVSEDSQKILSINEGKFPYLILGGLQEEDKKVTDLQNKVSSLEAENKNLKDRLSKLEEIVEKLL